MTQIKYFNASDLLFKQSQRLTKKSCTSFSRVGDQQAGHLQGFSLILKELAIPVI